MISCCRYDEARQAYAAAGQPHRASAILMELADCSISLRSFSDAGYYMYQLAKEALTVRVEPVAGVAPVAAIIIVGPSARACRLSSTAWANLVAPQTGRRAALSSGAAMRSSGTLVFMTFGVCRTQGTSRGS
jgi:hypothetical protein